MTFERRLLGESSDGSGSIGDSWPRTALAGYDDPIAAMGEITNQLIWDALEAIEAEGHQARIASIPINDVFPGWRSAPGTESPSNSPVERDSPWWLRRTAAS